jgi:hypothetical protein
MPKSRGFSKISSIFKTSSSAMYPILASKSKSKTRQIVLDKEIATQIIVA